MPPAKQFTLFMAMMLIMATNPLQSINQDLELKAKIAGMSRYEIIGWLQWNDHNGVYSDSDSLREFGNVVSKEEGETIMLRQILEG